MWNVYQTIYSAQAWVQISPASFSSDLRKAVFPLELSSLQSVAPRSLLPCSQDSSLDARSLENLRNGNQKLSRGCCLPSDWLLRCQKLGPTTPSHGRPRPTSPGEAPQQTRGQPGLPPCARLTATNKWPLQRYPITGWKVSRAKGNTTQGHTWYVIHHVKTQ